MTPAHKQSNQFHVNGLVTWDVYVKDSLICGDVSEKHANNVLAFVGALQNILHIAHYDDSILRSTRMVDEARAALEKAGITQLYAREQLK